MLQPYALQRKSISWFKKLGLHFVDRMVLNSYIAYKNIYPDYKRQYLDYIKEVARGLISEHSHAGAQMITDFARDNPPRLPSQQRGRASRRARPALNVARVRRSPRWCPPPSPASPAVTRGRARLHPVTPVRNVRRRLHGSSTPSSSPAPLASPLPTSPALTSTEHPITPLRNDRLPQSTKPASTKPSSH